MIKLYTGSLQEPNYAAEFIAQLDTYYASPTSSFYDHEIERRFYEQKLRHIGWTPYPKDGLVTFGASGTNMCDRQLVFKNDRTTKPEKDDDIPFRGRQRRVGNAVVDYIQMDIAHMPKRLGKNAKFRFAEVVTGTNKLGHIEREWLFEDAAEQRKVFEHPHPETGKLVKFAITAKPDGILEYGEDGKPFIFEFKTKATGIVEMNGKLDFKGAQEDHIRQTIAESLIFGINDVLIVYESTQKPSWFSDEETKSVPKTRKTWRDGQPIPDIRAFHIKVTDAMRESLLDDLARQVSLVYDNKERGTVPDVTLESVTHCGFCPYSRHCHETLTDDNREALESLERRIAGSNMAGKYEHRNLAKYLSE